MSPTATRTERLALTDEDQTTRCVQVQYRPLTGRGDSSSRVRYFMLMCNGERIATLSQRPKSGRINITQLRAKVASVMGASSARLIEIAA